MTPNDIAKFVDELQRGHRACADPGCWRREAAKLIEALAAPPDIATAIEFHARRAGLTVTYVPEEIAQFVTRLRNTPLYDGGGELVSMGENAAYLIEKLAAPPNGRSQAHFQSGYNACLCRGDLRPLCCIAQGIEAEHADRLASIKL